MAQFATAEELADRLGIEFSAQESARADGLLAGASGLVVSELGQQLEIVDGDELRTRGSREASIMLPGRPVVSVATITLGCHELPSSSWYIDGDELVRPGGWGHPGQELVITYTHGFAEIPAAIKEIVLAAATRVWANPTNVLSERLGQAQTTYAANTPTGLLLTAEERRSARRATSRSVGSVPIR